MGYSSSEPLDPKQATATIREIARLGEIILSRHCREESLPNRNLHFQDLLAVLINGEVIEPPIYDEGHHQYKYRVEGSTIDGEDAVAITVVLDRRSLYIVTIY